MQSITSIYKLLSDETRLRILMLIKEEPLCVCELVGILDVPQPRISKNLSKFRDLGLVVDERKEKYIFYTLKNDVPLLNNALNYLSENITDYPVFVEDHSKLKDKAQYLTSCQTFIQIDGAL